MLSGFPKLKIEWEAPIPDRGLDDCLGGLHDSAPQWIGRAWQPPQLIILIDLRQTLSSCLPANVRFGKTIIEESAVPSGLNWQT